MEEKITCHDCGVSVGEAHKPGCDWERCPFCWGQLISCDCAYRFFGLDPDTLEHDMLAIYEHGLTPAMSALWDYALKKKGLLKFKDNPIEKKFDEAPEGKLNELYAETLYQRVKDNDVDTFYEKLFP